MLALFCWGVSASCFAGEQADTLSLLFVGSMRPAVKTAALIIPDVLLKFPLKS